MLCHYINSVFTIVINLCCAQTKIISVKWHYQGVIENTCLIDTVKFSVTVIWVICKWVALTVKWVFLLFPSYVWSSPRWSSERPVFQQKNNKREAIDSKFFSLLMMPNCSKKETVPHIKETSSNHSVNLQLVLNHRNGTECLRMSHKFFQS